MVASETLSSQAICLLRLPSRNMMSTLYCWGVRLASLVAKSGPSLGSGWREIPSGTQLSPPITVLRALTSSFMGTDLGMKPSAPRRSTCWMMAGSSEAETTTMGRSG